MYQIPLITPEIARKELAFFDEAFAQNETYMSECVTRHMHAITFLISHAITGHNLVPVGALPKILREGEDSNIASGWINTVLAPTLIQEHSFQQVFTKYDTEKFGIDLQALESELQLICVADPISAKYICHTELKYDRLFFSMEEKGV